MSKKSHNYSKIYTSRIDIFIKSEVKEWLKIHAFKKGITYSDIIRELLDKYMEEEKSKEPKISHENKQIYCLVPLNLAEINGISYELLQ